MLNKIKGLLLKVWAQRQAQPAPVLIPVGPQELHDRIARPRGVFSNAYRFQNHL